MKLLKLKTLVLASLFVLTTFTLMAQNQQGEKRLVSEAYDEFAPHWFLQLQGGASYTVGEADFTKLLSPSAALNIGYKFNKLLALRLGVSGWQGKGSWVYPRHDYQWNFVQGNLDAMLDLSALFSEFNPKRVFNPYIFIGGGANYSFNNDEAVKAHNGADVNFRNLWKDNLISPVGRGGIGINFRLSDLISLNIEGNANVLSDKFNSKKADNPDFHFGGLVGLKINLGKSYTHHDAVYEYIEPAPLPEPKREEPKIVEPEPKEEPVVVKPEPLTVNVFFLKNKSDIRESEQSQLLALLEYLNSNVDTKVSLTGYADEDTGSSEYNMKLSKDRVSVVKSYLISQGIDESRISTEAKGDLEQPYTKAEENRVTVCITK